ncbi:DUF4274 domain-containing protein [Bradyrhizobium sp. LjRoot220]|uniref:DUF4274 domain-containing protein n=1 Tax=Bradyrhizobium sp. LjRoot220 TaxID=3342284 RepID=UPI003ED0F9AD
MSADAIRDQTQPDGDRPSDEEITRCRDYLYHYVMVQGYVDRPFEGLSWDYFLADVQLEARAARVSMRDQTVGSICDTIQVLPPTAIIRLRAARYVYFSPLAPENEAQVDEVLQPLDAATVKLMRQRRHAVHAIHAIEAKQEAGRKEAAARHDELLTQWYKCPHARISSEPEDFLRWIKVQTPDTWHVIVESWDYNAGDRDDVIEWIFEQPNCDLGTAAQSFFTVGLADEEPEKLSPGYRRSWHLMKRIADNWQNGFYVRNELQHSVEPSHMKYYDELIARRNAEGRPLPWKVPGPNARRFGARRPDSAYFYEHGHLKLGFAVWKRHRERSGCGRDFPRCCEA